MPYQKCITRFDNQNTWFYLDPPYWGNETDYGNTFTREDFVALEQLLRGLEGKFLLSLNDIPETRELFKGFPIRQVDVTYHVGAYVGSGKKVKEILISNYELPEIPQKKRKK